MISCVCYNKFIAFSIGLALWQVLSVVLLVTTAKTLASFGIISFFSHVTDFDPNGMKYLKLMKSVTCEKERYDAKGWVVLFLLQLRV